MSSHYSHTSQNNAPTSFTIDTFSSQDFVLKDFIETLTKDAMPAARTSGGTTLSKEAFDPKPLIRSFENSLKNLQLISKAVETREAQLRADVRRAEADHNKTISSLKRDLNKAVSRYNQLESSLNSVSNEFRDTVSSLDARNGRGGHDAVKIGEKLEVVDKQRQRMIDAKFLIQCWLEVTNEGTLSTLEGRRRLAGSKEKIRCAQTAWQLLRICPQIEDKDRRQGPDDGGTMSPPSRERRQSNPLPEPRAVIEDFLGVLEEDLLGQFNIHYRDQDFPRVWECAKALRDFNNGTNVITTFLNQHRFFLEYQHPDPNEQIGDDAFRDKLANPDPDCEYSFIDPILRDLVDSAQAVLQEEAITIKKAFPYPDEVMVRLIIRIFQESIQKRLGFVLEKAADISTLAFLRSLQASRNYISSMVETLKVHGLIDHPESTSAHITTILDQQLDELFGPYLINSFYLDREKKNLEELFQSLLFKFMIYHSRRKRNIASYLTAFGRPSNDMITSLRELYLDRLCSPNMTPLHQSILLSLAGLRVTDLGKRSDIEASELDGELGIEKCKRMMQWLAESVGRILELGSTTEAPKDLNTLLASFLMHMDEVYVRTALEAIHDTLQAQVSSKEEPHLNCFPSLKAAITVLFLIQSTIKATILPLTSPNIPVYRHTSSMLTTATTNIESQISTVVHDIIDVVLAWAKRILEKQKESDFQMSDTSEGAPPETDTVVSVRAFFFTVVSRLEAHLDGKNVSYFMSELAFGFRNLLLSHFQQLQFTISRQGGMLVSQDINGYIGMVKGWSIDDDSEFAQTGGTDILDEVANIFVIPLDALWDRLRPSHAIGSTNAVATLAPPGHRDSNFPPNALSPTASARRSVLPAIAIASPAFLSPTGALPTLTSTGLAIGRPIFFASPTESVFPVGSPLPSAGLSVPSAMRSPVSANGEAPRAGAVSPLGRFSRIGPLSFISLGGNDVGDGSGNSNNNTTAGTTVASPTQPWDELSWLRKIAMRREDASTPEGKKILSSL